MEEAMKRRHIPAFGSWNHCEMLPAAQYAAAAPPAGLFHGGAGLHGGYAGGGGHLYPPHLPYSYYWQDPGEDLFQVPPPAPVVVAAYPRKVSKEVAPEQQLKRRKPLQQHQQKKGQEAASPQQIKQGKVCDCNAPVRQPPRPTRAAVAVDEDLYKVPPKLLCEKSRRKKMVMSDFWSRCLGLSCIP